MRINTFLISSLIAGLAAGVVYVVPALATGASAAALIIGGTGAAVISTVIEHIPLRIEVEGGARPPGSLPLRPAR